VTAVVKEDPPTSPLPPWTILKALLKLGTWRNLGAEVLSLLPVPRPPPRASKACDERWAGHWLQSSIEKDKFEALLRLNGVPWAVRKAAQLLKAEFQFTTTDDPTVLNIRERLPTGWGSWRVLREGETFTENLLGMVVTGKYTFCDERWPEASWVQHNVERARGMKDHRTTLVFSFDAEASRLEIKTEQDEPHHATFDKWCSRK
jgi:hypothetical protein